MKNKNLLQKIKDFIIEPDKDIFNNIIKALLLGLIGGLLIGFTGEDWDFHVHLRNGRKIAVAFCYYGTSQAIIGGIIISLVLFLKYNKKK